MKKCLVIGAAMLDIVMQIDRLPKTGEDVYAKSQEMTVGGCAYNVADILKHFQVPYTLFAPIGSGMYAEMVERKLEMAGHVSPIRSEKSDNGYCLCMVEADGERTFLTLPGIECTFEAEWFELIDTKEYDSVYICGYEIEGAGGEKIIRFLEMHPELKVYYAPGPRISYIEKEKHARIFQLHPVLHLNEKEALDYTGAVDAAQAAEKLQESTKNTVIITLGGEGALLREKDETRIIESGTAVVADTIGAGDSHIGAVIAMEQSGAQAESAVRTANQISALVVSVQGPSITKEVFEKWKAQEEK
ncbi:PfkB family carbohydrate kinase [Hespellia stercorisuis]|uniref:Sugar or nucleoside kinase, ribokinase family n=1 Tax=Hespellia stercorisuis DSM 15480 TaxID=1121950 RepID=A0A1M6QYH9_9FIRM|nr:PfkB family carbohydrate kinase [Hespellia stercorisuis]SHK25319.1 Sugar or nucleoside kinase, ribokinase family [Hespellia stercorisuis DSM 15480]